MHEIAILYGSQTGNSEDLAKRIGLMSKQHGLKVLVKTMDDYDLKQLPKEKLVLFVCSTTGHGQEPENMKNFYSFIRRRDLPKQCLSNLRFAVFGLGDSSYAKFNCVSKVLFKRLEACGAQPVQEITIGDEQHRFGCDGAIYPKLDELWHDIVINSSSENQRPTDCDSYTPVSSYSIKLNECEHTELIFTESYVEHYKVLTGSCLMNRRITSINHFQDTRLISFSVNSDITYEPGDVCCIRPANSDDNVRQFISALGLKADQKIIVRKRDPDYMVNYLYDFIPDGLTIYDLVKNYLDIQSIPRRLFFEFLWRFSDSELEKDKLKEFASTNGQEEMYEYCTQPKRTILEVLLDFPCTVKNIKLNYLLDLIPPIRDRSFSIASDIKSHPGELQLIVGRVEYNTRLRKTRLGLCSNYLSNLRPIDSYDVGDGKPDNLIFHLKRTAFKLPENCNTPVIMVGPGLGIAPFRSFVERRASNRIGQDEPNTHLYFGCRYRDKDFYFERELEEYAANNVIRLRVAFSRENPKTYVHDLIKSDEILIRDLITRQNAVIYVAGNSKLPEQIRKVIAEILDKTPGCRTVIQLESENRLQYDCW